MRSREEIEGAIKLCDFLESQCLLWKLSAEKSGDLRTVFMLETEIGSINALRKGIRWAAGLDNFSILDQGIVQRYEIKDT